MPSSSDLGVRVWVKPPPNSSSTTIAAEQQTPGWLEGVVKGHHGEELVVATTDGRELRVSAAEAPLQNAETVDVSVFTACTCVFVCAARLAVKVQVWAVAA